MIPKVKYYGPQIPSTYAVNMTAAASGSNGITVADDDDIDFGTGDFFLHWEGSLPDWTPASDVPIYFKYQSASNFNFVYVTAAGKLRCYARVGGVVLIDKTSVASIPATDNVPLKITIVCVRESASAAGTVSFYASGTLLESQSITAAATVSISNTGVLDICGNSSAGVRYASNSISCIVGNFAPTAAEVATLCTTGIPESWKWGSQTAQTSGALVVGKMYRINTYVAGDDFTNVGAASNATGARFTASGTTPTTWTNSSSLVKIGATLALLHNSIPTSGATAWDDSSGNTGGGTLPAAGATKVTIRK